MKVIEKISNLIRKPKKSKILIKSKFGLPTVRVCGVVLVDTSTAAAALAGDPTTDYAAGLSSETVLAGDLAQSGGANDLITGGTNAQTVFRDDGNKKIEDIYLKNNEDAKDLIVNLAGVVTIGFGMANEKYEAIRVSYDSLSDLNALIKIYSFTSGLRMIFAQDSKQKKKYSDILNSMKISSVDVVDLINFE